MNTPSHEETLFQAAAALTGPERAPFLDRECAGDNALRARLDALLAAHDASDGALASHGDTRPTIARELPDLPDPVVGMNIGRYKLLEKLGEGGCGVVYVAEQTEPVRRRVALKVIKLGMDTKQVVARFEAERQALAMMDHPNIAKVLDAGTTEAGISQNPNQQSDIPTGRPYFVMELVRGIRITDYCDQNKLPIKERLDLFIKVGVTCMVLSPNGRRLATGGAQGIATLWDIETLREVAVLGRHAGLVFSVCFLPDGETLLSVDNYDLKIWRAPRDTHRGRMDHEHDPQMIPAPATNHDTNT